MGNLRIEPLPIRMASVDLKQHWHARFHRDPANQWLRGLIHEEFGGAAIAPGRPAVKSSSHPRTPSTRDHDTPGQSPCHATCFATRALTACALAAAARRRSVRAGLPRRPCQADGGLRARRSDRFYGRIAARVLTDALGREVLVENRPGGSGAIAAARSRPRRPTDTRCW